jgi:hypothetical protein
MNKIALLALLGHISVSQALVLEQEKLSAFGQVAT